MVLPVVLQGTAAVRGRCPLHVREEADGQECWSSALVACGDLRHAHHIDGDRNSLWLTIREYEYWQIGVATSLPAPIGFARRARVAGEP